MIQSNIYITLTSIPCSGDMANAVERLFLQLKPPPFRVRMEAKEVSFGIGRRSTREVLASRFNARMRRPEWSLGKSADTSR
jgi:hypothetical protein